MQSESCMHARTQGRTHARTQIKLESIRAGFSFFQLTNQLANCLLTLTGGLRRIVQQLCYVTEWLSTVELSRFVRTAVIGWRRSHASMMDAHLGYQPIPAALCSLLYVSPYQLNEFIVNISSWNFSSTVSDGLFCGKIFHQYHKENRVCNNDIKYRVNEFCAILQTVDWPVSS